MPNTPEIRQLRKLIGSEKSKKPLMKLAIIRSRNPEPGVYKNFEHELHGSGKQLYDNDD